MINVFKELHMKYETFGKKKKKKKKANLLNGVLRRKQMTWVL